MAGLMIESKVITEPRRHLGEKSYKTTYRYLTGGALSGLLPECCLPLH
jgi:hypothetical protein